MSARTFLDTNVLLYADNIHFPAKRERAESLISEVTAAQSGHVSMQVLLEYFRGATRKLHLSADLAQKRVVTYSQFEVVIPDPGDLLAAIDLHREHQFSIFDALIVRAALISHCEILYTEDMQDGRRIDGLTIVNPFR
jgi:predicted nucleic acid-binding protein